MSNLPDCCKPDKPLSFAALKAALKNAGYVLERADITVTAKLQKERDVWIVVAESSGQKFALEGTSRINSPRSPAATSEDRRIEFNARRAGGAHRASW